MVECEQGRKWEIHTIYVVFLRIFMLWYNS